MSEIIPSGVSSVLLGVVWEVVVGVVGVLVILVSEVLVVVVGVVGLLSTGRLISWGVSRPTPT